MTNSTEISSDALLLFAERLAADPKFSKTEAISIFLTTVGQIFTAVGATLGARAMALSNEGGAKPDSENAHISQPSASDAIES